ncbi:hypothetical protein B0T24DRAFT_677683 [Lasiosphaeria ovina]|uniref:Uncharacterized protein n=1 Tax=Lasiosphaeria ovina TaxID=92902 RepID=A0AAE0KJ54_9PEZI|nr:hypothetical protein B0T24DRAFT_677683 [Lasiosphaeria ovina]
MPWYKYCHACGRYVPVYARYYRPSRRDRCTRRCSQYDLDVRSIHRRRRVFYDWPYLRHRRVSIYPFSLSLSTMGAFLV